MNRSTNNLRSKDILYTMPGNFKPCDILKLPVLVQLLHLNISCVLSAILCSREATTRADQIFHKNLIHFTKFAVHACLTQVN